MKFHVEHVFSGIDLAAFETLFFDEPSNILLCQALKLQRTLLRRDLENGTLHRVCQMVPDRVLPAPLAKVLGSNHVEYTESLDYVMGSYHGTWKTVPSLLADKGEAAGTFSFVARGAQVARLVEGEVRVKIFGLGSIIERFIVAEVEKTYAQAAFYMQQHLHGNILQA